MKTYEALVIFPAQASTELLQEGKSNPFEETVKKHEGKIVNRSDMGKRLLGYRVKKAQEGYFVAYIIELSPDKMDSFKRSLGLIEGILKFTIVNKPKVELGRPHQLRQAPVQTIQVTEKR